MPYEGIADYPNRSVASCSSHRRMASVRHASVGSVVRCSQSPDGAKYPYEWFPPVVRQRPVREVCTCTTMKAKNSPSRISRWAVHHPLTSWVMFSRSSQSSVIAKLLRSATRACPNAPVGLSQWHLNAARGIVDPSREAVTSVLRIPTRVPASLTGQCP
jgi:hypothetical protein